MKRFALIVVCLGLCSLARADWPQFLGPDRDGISNESTELAKDWSAGQPKVLWTAETGPGYGGPSIVGDELFILDRVDDQRDVLRCLSMTDGSEKWRFAYDAPGKISHNGSRSTPAVDDKHVYTIGPFGDLHAIDRKTHQPVWHLNILDQFDAKKPHWAVSTSPVLFGDMLIVAPCGTKAGLVAVNKNTGDVIWQSEPCGSQQYMSPMPVKIDGVDQLLAYGKAGRKVTKLIAVNPTDGKTLWTFDGWGCSIAIASPIHVGDGKVFMTGGYGAGSVMIQVSRDAAGNWSTEELWRLDRKEAGSQICDPLVWKGHLYIDNNENGKNLGMVCVDLDGNIKWSSNEPNCNRGGQIIADGMMYKLDGRNGSLYLVNPTPEKFDVVSEATGLLNPGELWAPLAISKGRLIIRDHGQLKCLDVR